MPLQSSGAISFLDLQNEYGGSNPIGMDEYYRNGALVPNSITVYEPSASTYNYARTGTTYYWQDSFWGPNTRRPLIWAGTQITTFGGTGDTTYSDGTYTYTRDPGGWQSREDQGSSVCGSAGTQQIYHTFFGVRRESTLLVNQNVPTAGTISMNQFYGGRKT